MNVLMVLDHNYPPDVRVEKEIDSLVKANHNVILACYNFKSNSLPYEEINGYKIYRKRINSLMYKSSVAILKFPIYEYFWKQFLKSIFRKEVIDVIHIHDLPLARLGLYYKKLYKIPLVVDLHENWPHSMEIASHTNTLIGKILSSNNQWHQYERTILLQADVVITVIDEMKKRIENLGIPGQKLKIVSNSLDVTDFYIPNNIKENTNELILFYAGGINIHRGLQVVINALPIILSKMKNVKLQIIGKGSYLNELKKLAENLEITDHIDFLGWKNMEEIASYLSQSDIALIPHLKSVQTDCSSPNKIYQYVFAKKPILSSNCDSLERMIKEMKCGLIYKHNSPEDFARKFFELYHDKDNKINLEYGKKLILEKYNWDLDSKVLLEIYQALEK